ncbi:hypothetical protein JB92DRAFT_3139246, partial [Gautieria morchelliformis]
MFTLLQVLPAWSLFRRLRLPEVGPLGIVVRCSLTHSPLQSNPPPTPSRPSYAPHMPFPPSSTPSASLHPCDVHPHRRIFERRPRVRPVVPVLVRGQHGLSAYRHRTPAAVSPAKAPACPGSGRVCHAPRRVTASRTASPCPAQARGSPTDQAPGPCRSPPQTQRAAL